MIVGVSQTSLDVASAFVGTAMAADASGIMASPCAGLRTEEHVIGFFETFVGWIGADVPIALQDYPQNTGVFLSIETLDRLLTRFPSIQVFKHEEGSALRRITRLRSLQPGTGRRRVSILVSNSGIHLPQELRRGVDGADTGVAFPEMLVEVCKRFLEAFRTPPKISTTSSCR